MRGPDEGELLAKGSRPGRPAPEPAIHQYAVEVLARERAGERVLPRLWVWALDVARLQPRPPE